MREARIVARETPLGRPLVAADYCKIVWTVEAPEDAVFPEAAPRRQHILKRLLEEAAAQGAAPTDADLAEALGVSRRTVLRDAKALEASGISLPTRRRLRAK